MTDVFNLLLSLSLSGSAAGLTLLIIRTLAKNKITKSWQYYMWLVVLFRYSLPFALKLNLIDDLFQKPGTFTPDFNIHLLFRTNLGIDVGLSKNLWIVWLLGLAVIVSKKAIQLIRFNRAIRKTSELITDTKILNIFNECLSEMKIKRKVAVYQSRIVTTPMLTGLLSPVLYLPTAPLDEKQLRYVFFHELIHYRRKDLWYKWFLQLLLCIHWFNPFFYVIAHTINRDCELSCDEAVIRKLGPYEKREYGETIIEIADLSRNAGRILAVSMCDEKEIMKERLGAILHYKKQNKLMIFLSVSLLIAVFGISAVMGFLVIN
ncbi:M56 family metallopeptidase [Anaerolentibacter hominis]|uniref:M56 family metallopeptidase n=1 Tax=Anaerolentibacter hominis TaxID=3079009 RepID=UPI0031B7F4E5